jgi:outer membrane immunogenic protein
MIRKTLAVALAVAPLGLVLADPLLAADLAAKGPFQKAPPPPLPWSWAGFYLGVNLGYGVGQGNGSIPFGPGAAVPAGVFSFDSQPVGLLGGGQAGYNAQFGSIVLGVETDIQGGNINDNVTCVAQCAAGTGITLSQELSWFGTTRARAGWASGPVLTYVTGGVAYGATDTKLNASLAGAAGSIDVNSTKVGWTWGTGVEAAVDGNWSVKLEWLYVDLGTSSGSITVSPGGGVAGVPVGVSTKYQEQIFRGGLNYKFGGSGAAATLPMPVNNWAGFYLGGNVGYALGRDPSILNVPGVASESYDLSPRGLSGGGLVGYNWQFGRWVAGVEADIQGVDEGGRAAIACLATCGAVNGALIEQEMPWFGTVRGRLGVSAGPALFYATGGYAYGRVNDSITEATGPTITGFSFNHDNSGWAIGGGIDNTFDLFGWFGPNWLTRTEYLYVDLGKMTDTFTNGGATQTLTSGSHTHIFRSALIYKFTP